MEDKMNQQTIELNLLLLREEWYKEQRMKENKVRFIQQLQALQRIYKKMTKQ